MGFELGEVHDTTSAVWCSNHLAIPPLASSPLSLDYIVWMEPFPKNPLMPSPSQFDAYTQLSAVLLKDSFQAPATQARLLACILTRQAYVACKIIM